MTVQNLCRSYFNGFKDLAKSATTQQRVGAFLKIVSYATIVVPIIFGVVWAASLCLKGRVTHSPVTRSGKAVIEAFRKSIKPSHHQRDDLPLIAQKSSPQNQSKEVQKKESLITKKDCQKINRPNQGSLRKVIHAKKLHANKRILLERAQRNYGSEEGFENHLKTIRVVQADDSTRFELTGNKSPSYFKEKIQVSRSESVEFSRGFYDYKSSDKGVYWVDFANKRLGGGCFGNGFVQEEIMVQEMPGFAALIASNLGEDKIHSNLLTRAGGEGPMQGSPTPLLIEGLTRTIALDTAKKFKVGNTDIKCYGHEGSKLNEDQLQECISDTRQENINLIAVAAPRLKAKADSCQRGVVIDLFNTVFAGFSLAKEKANTTPVVINSGPIGCGAFNNNPVAACLVQMLAAKHLGVELKLWAISQEDQKKALKIWKEVELSNITIEQALTKLQERL